MNRATHSKDVQDYRLDELEDDYETLVKLTYRLALRHEDFRQELQKSREETKQGLIDFSDLLHSRFFWLTLALLAGLCILGVLGITTWTNPLAPASRPGRSGNRPSSASPHLKTGPTSCASEVNLTWWTIGSGRST